MNNLLNISWISTSAPTIGQLALPITLGRKAMEDAVAQTAALFIWLGMW